MAQTAGTAAEIQQAAAQTQILYGTIIMLQQTQIHALQRQRAQAQAALIATVATYATTSAKGQYSHLCRR